MYLKLSSGCTVQTHLRAWQAPGQAPVPHPVPSGRLGLPQAGPSSADPGRLGLQVLEYPTQLAARQLAQQAAQRRRQPHRRLQLLRGVPKLATAVGKEKGGIAVP